MRKTASLWLGLALLLGSASCWGQRLPTLRASTSRPSARVTTAPDTNFPGQVRPDSLASTLPEPLPRAAPAPAAPPAPAKRSAEMEQLDYLKQKVNLGMPLEPDERLFLLMWMRDHPQKPKPAAVSD